MTEIYMSFKLISSNLSYNKNEFISKMFQGKMKPNKWVREARDFLKENFIFEI